MSSDSDAGAAEAGDDSRVRARVDLPETDGDGRARDRADGDDAGEDERECGAVHDPGKTSEPGLSSAIGER